MFSGYPILLENESMITFPVKIKTSAKFIAELARCETGRNEDANYFREVAAGKKESKDYTQEEANKICDENSYWVTFCDFSERHKTMVEVRNIHELCELYYACASGTIGLSMKTPANNILDKIRNEVRLICPTLVNHWPRQEGY